MVLCVEKTGRTKAFHCRFGIGPSTARQRLDATFVRGEYRLRLWRRTDSRNPRTPEPHLPVMKTSFPIILALAALALLSIGGRSNVGAAAEGVPDNSRFGELERRVARIETHLGRDALGWRTSGTIAKRLESLERKAKDSERDNRPSFPGKMNSTTDSSRLAVDMRSLRHDLESLDRRVKEHATQLSRTRINNGSDSNRREIERLRRDVEKLQSEIQRLERR